MNTREKTIAEIREHLERADAARLAFVLAFLRAGERGDPSGPAGHLPFQGRLERAAEGVGPYKRE